MWTHIRRSQVASVTRHSAGIAPAFSVTFIWNGDMPSQGIVRQVGWPNGSISLPSAQPTCHTDMRGWWVGVQMIVTSLMNYLQALPCGILPALPPNFPVAFQQDSARIVLNFPRDIAHSFPVTFIWNGDLPSQGIVRQVGCPNGSISPPSAQPTCPTDMRGWWVSVQMIVTSLMKFSYNILFLCEIYCQIILYL